ncbi:hypothetical protein ACLKA6_003945 [Drosophila palustris]
MSDPENDKQVNKRGSKHMRLRYYSSYEEATIVKLWRENLDQITSYTENLQIFRDIASGMQQHGIRLNKQEVRRRISNYRNKYLTEHGRVENDPQYKSPWRLYPLVDSLFQSTTSPTGVQSEQQLIEQIECNVRNELHSLPRFSRHDCRTMKFNQNPDGCPFLDVQPTMPAIIIKTESKDYDEFDAATPEKRSPLAPVNRNFEQLSNSFDIGGASRRIRRRSIMPRTGQITLAQIEALRKENDLLAEQRDDSLKDLELKEREYLKLEQTLDFWLHQQEIWLAYLADRSIK